MTPLTFFGVTAVTGMLVFYALEERARLFVLLFATACAASSLYGFLQGAWPFGIVEGVWTGVAFRRWHARATPSATQRPIACDMTALSREERQRYDELRSRVLDATDSVTATADAFQLRLAASVPAEDIAAWMVLEHRCCPFLRISITIQSDDTRWLEIGGSAAIKDFLRGEFRGVLR